MRAMKSASDSFASSSGVRVISVISDSASSCICIESVITPTLSPGRGGMGILVETKLEDSAVKSKSVPLTSANSPVGICVAVTGR